jgi:putative inorganic carbon (hco3(-)) transporter
MTMFIPVLLVSMESLKKLLLVVTLSLGFIGVKFGLFGVIHGGVRFVEGYGGFLSDNNAVALALAMAFPLLMHSREMIASRWARLGLLAAAILSMAAVVMTYSRGGALALGVALGFVLLQSRRRLGIAVLLLVPLAYFVTLVGEGYTQRMETIKNPNGEASSFARMQYAENAIEIGKDYPLLGVGFGTKNQMAIQHNYVQFVGGAQVIHNTYLQMLTDSGVPALLIYVTLLFGTIIYLLKAIRRAVKNYPEWAPIPKALCGALVTWSVGSVFLSKIDFDLTYVLIVAAGAWYNAEQRYRIQSAVAARETEPEIEEQPAMA